MTRLRLWWVPLLIALAPVVGLIPAHRDLIDFFLPMKAATGAMIAGGAAPWLNFANGCGEAWFANPETGLLYPPAWLHAVLPPTWALAAEVGLHLAWLSLGAGLVARLLGAGRAGRAVVEIVAWSAGPILSTVGVLNNLQTLSWLPWMVIAAHDDRRKSVPLVALTMALAWLGGEPQIWALGLGLTILVAARRSRVVAGVALGIAVSAVQMVPFIFWVLEGDRGPTAAAKWALKGSLTLGDWLYVLVPGMADSPGRTVYAESLFLGAPILLCVLLGGRRFPWLFGGAVALVVLATLPGLGAEQFFLRGTLGLVRYPSRFALVGCAMLIPLCGWGAEAWIEGRGKIGAAVLGVVTVFGCLVGTDELRWWVAGVPAVLLIVAAITRPAAIRIAALAAGVIASMVAALPLLDLRPVATQVDAESPWPELTSADRVYTPPVTSGMMPWVADDLWHRRLWPIGYTNLADGNALTRTFAPVVNRNLVAHLAQADRGPSHRWWLDTMAARYVILPAQTPVPLDMVPVARREGLQLLRNLRAMAVAGLANEPPAGGRSGRGVTSVTTTRQDAARLEVNTWTNGPGWIWLSLAPVRGWKWQLDGRPVVPRIGPGVVQAVAVGPGRHRLTGVYRPPGFVPSAILSFLAAAALVVMVLRTSTKKSPGPHRPRVRLDR